MEYRLFAGRCGLGSDGANRSLNLDPIEESLAATNLIVDASLRQKLTPGGPQAVQIKIPKAVAIRLAKLRREGKPPLAAAA